MAHADSLRASEEQQRRRPEPSHFRPDIEGLRAVAVTAVVLFHAAVPGIRDTLFCEGRWLAPAASGWTEIPAPERGGLPAPADAPPPLRLASALSEGKQPDPWTTT